MGLKNNDIIQSTFRGLCFGQQIILDLTFQIFGDFPVGNSVSTDLDLINAAIAPGGVQNIVTPYLACLPAQYSLLELRSQLIFPTRSAYRQVAFVGAVGTDPGAATVANDSAALTLRTEKSGRSQVATKHIGPVPDNVSAAGLIVAAYKLSLAALGAKLVTSFVPPTSGSLVVPVIYHRQTNTTDLVNQYILGDQSRVQRRRTVGVGA